MLIERTAQTQMLTERTALYALLEANIYVI